MRALRFLMTIAMVGSLSFCAIAEDASAAFDAANKLYAQGKFAEAAGAYETIASNGVVSAALQFNLGNANFKAGQIGKAIAAYRAAESIAPRDPDLRANLQFALNRIQGPTLKPSWLERNLGRVSLNEWTFAAMLGVWSVFALLVVRQIRPGLRPVLRGWTWGVAAISIIFLSLTGLALSQQKSGAVAIVTQPDVTVRNSPLEEAPSSFTVHDGAELRVLDHKDDWLQISDGGQRYGWLKRSVVHWAPRS